MRIALAGRPGAGKSSLFDLLEGKASEGFTPTGLRIAHVLVPDPRVQDLSRVFEPKKTTPARLEFQDLEQKSGPTYPTLSPERREMLSNADLILLVVELFGTDPADWAETAQTQIQELAEECVILDLTTVEKRLERIEKLIKSGQKPAFPSEPEDLKAIHASLSEGRPCRELPVVRERERELRGFGFLTSRSVLAAFNVGEDHLESAREQISALSVDSAFDDKDSTNRIVFSAEVEHQILELPAADQESFMSAFGLAESAVDQTIRAAYSRAGLQSFFTVGKDEVRAWSLRIGATAPEAAGAIHTDLQKGFVRAEVLSYAEWETLRSMTAAKDQGKLRLEGKDYVIMDGDIVNIRSGLAKSKG